MIELPIFWQGETLNQLEDLGVEIERDLTDTECRTVAFFKVDNVQTYEEDGIEYSIVNSGGKEFICKYNYETTKDLVIKNLK